MVRLNKLNILFTNVYLAMHQTALYSNIPTITAPPTFTALQCSNIHCTAMSQMSLHYNVPIWSAGHWPNCQCPACQRTYWAGKGQVKAGGQVPSSILTCYPWKRLFRSIVKFGPSGQMCVQIQCVHSYCKVKTVQPCTVPILVSHQGQLSRIYSGQNTVVQGTTVIV